MKITDQTYIYDIDDAFSGKWVNVRFKNGQIKKVFMVDIDFDNDISEAIVYNTTGSFSYGNAIYLKDVDQIEVTSKD
ncbi:hypothetical protein [Limosilactobacillus gastricus]|uniref:hypothetical protein n=1 Tax=Limosilactobacillus gastricus TaxID=227942 RepID=UPI0003028316|nr:hypothetical protein [Limosilactobacillus gastricus]